jgi:hypothetical protein
MSAVRLLVGQPIAARAGADPDVENLSAENSAVAEKTAFCSTLVF